MGKDTRVTISPALRLKMARLQELYKRQGKGYVSFPAIFLELAEYGMDRLITNAEKDLHKLEENEQ